MRKQSLQALYKRCQHSSYVLNKSKSKLVKALPLVTRQYNVPSIMHTDYNSRKYVREINQWCSEANRWYFLHTVFDKSALPETVCTFLINLIKLLHRCATNLSLSFRSVRELYSQSFDLRQEIKSLAVLLEQYNTHLSEQNSKHWRRMHVPNRMLLANYKLISTVNFCIRHHNSFADYKYNRLKNVCVSHNDNSNNERQHAKYILQLSAWYKKQMECNVITAEDVPHVLSVIKVNSHRNDVDCNDSNVNIRSNTKAVVHNNKTNSPNEQRSADASEQMSIKTSIEQATTTPSCSTNTMTTCAQSSSYVLAFILASLEQDMEYGIVEPLCSLLSIEDKLFLLQYYCCTSYEEECEEAKEEHSHSKNVKSIYDKGSANSTNKEWQTQIELLAPAAKKLCISLINELADNPTYLAYIPTIKLIPVINTLHHNNMLTKTFLQHALLRVWQCNYITMLCSAENYIQRILLTLHVAELYLPHHTIASMLHRSEMYFESCAYQSQIAREFVVNTQPRSAHGLELIICRLITEYVQEKLNSSQIDGVSRVDNDAIDKYIRCAPYTNNTSIVTTFTKLLQMMPTALQSYSVQLLLYTLGHCLREHQDIPIDFDNIVHELHLQELGVQSITTTMEIIKHIHFVLRQGSRQTASVLLNGLHTKQEIAAVMKRTHNAGSTMALHALRQLMLIQPSLECYVAITIKAQNELVDKANSNFGYNMLHNSRNRSKSKYGNHTIITFHVQRDRVELGNEMWLSEQFMSNNALCPFYRLPEREQRIFYHTVLSTVIHGSSCDFAAFASYITPTEQAMPQIALPSLLAAVPLCAINKIVRSMPSKTSDALSYWAMCELYARHVYEAMKVLHAATVHHIMPEMAVLVHLLEVCEELQLNYLHSINKSEKDKLVDAKMYNDKLCKVKMTKESITRKAMKSGASNRMMTTKATSETNDKNNEDYSIIFDNAVHFVEEHFSDVALVVFRAYVERFYTRHGKSTLPNEESTIKSVKNMINTKSTHYCSNSDNIKERKWQEKTNKHSLMSIDVSNFIISFVLHHLIPNCISHQLYKSCARMTTTNNNNNNNKNSQGMYNFMHYKVNHSVSSNNNKANMYLESIPLQWEIINALVHNMTATEDNYDDTHDSNYVAEVDVIVRSLVAREIDWWSSCKATSKASLIKQLYRQGATSLWPLAWQEIQHVIAREQTTTNSHMCNLYNLQSNIYSRNETERCNALNKCVQYIELMQVHRALRLMICGCANSSECLERIRSCEHLFMPHEQQQTRKGWIANQLGASNELRAIHTLSLAANVFIRRGDYRIALELLPPYLNETLPPQLRLIQLTAMQQTEEFAELATLLLSDTLAECQVLHNECCTHNKQYQKRNIRLATRKRKSKLCRLCKVWRRKSALHMYLHKTQSCKDIRKSDIIISVNKDENADKMTTQQLLELQGMLYKRPLRKFVRSIFNGSVGYESVN